MKKNPNQKKPSRVLKTMSTSAQEILEDHASVIHASAIRKDRAEDQFEGQERTKTRGLCMLYRESPTGGISCREWIPLIPPVVEREIRYSTHFSLKAERGKSAIKCLRANDLVHIEGKEGGHRPTFLDHMMQFYQQFRVLKTKLTLTIKGQKPTTDLGLRVVRSNASSSDNFDEMLAGATTFVCSREGNIPRLIAYLDIYDFLGKRDDKKATGTSEESPEESLFFQIFAGDRERDMDVHIDCLVEYIVMFTSTRHGVTSVNAAIAVAKKEELSQFRQAGPYRDDPDQH